MAKHVAASASNEEALAIVEKVKADTDEVIDVIFPDGNPHWSQVVDLVQPDSCRLLFIHAGSAGDMPPMGGTGKTHIIDDCVINAPVFIATPNGKPDCYVRRFGFSYTQTNDSRKQGSANMSGHYNTPTTPQRFVDDHNTYNSKSTGLGFGGRVIGVAHHNIFNCYASTAAFFNSWSDAQGDLSWTEDSDLGTENFPFIEDCIINVFGSAGISDSYRGSRFVIRFCTSNGAATQTHPTGGSNRARGSRAWEVYGILFRSPAGKIEHNFFFMSSGTGMVFFNDAAGLNNFITMHCMRRDPTTYPQSPTPTGWGYAGTSFNGVGSNWDGNEDPVTGYPNIDQIGRGKGDKLSGDFGPGMINEATGKNYLDPGAYPRQLLEPVYIFGNTYVGPGTQVADQSSGTLKLKRDYYTDEIGGGIGKGLALPTTAGLPGEGFVLLNGGSWLNSTPEYGVKDTPNFKLYVRDQNGVWQPKYQPFEYPHKYIAATKYLDGPIVIPPDPIPVPDPVPVPEPAPEPIPEPNKPPTIQFVKPDKAGASGELITEGKIITIKDQYLKVEASDDVGPVQVEIWVNNVRLISTDKYSFMIKWNTAPYRGKNVAVKAKVTDADMATAEQVINVKVKK